MKKEREKGKARVGSLAREKKQHNSTSSSIQA